MKKKKTFLSLPVRPAISTIFLLLTVFQIVKADDPILVTVIVEPNPTRVLVNNDQIFNAYGYDQDGDPFPLTNTHWTCKGGGTLAVISPDVCKYSATEVGSWWVTCAQDDRAGQAIVNVVGHLDRIEVTPPEMTMRVGQTQQFQAKGYLDGDEVTINPIWSATGGTISSEGLYTATTQGDFTVTASVNATPPVTPGTAIVHVVHVTIDLDRIEVFPGEVTMQVGLTQQFQAKGYDSDGGDVPIDPKWSATGGTITSSPGSMMKVSLVDSATATYTALEAGDHIVVCQDSTTGISDTAYVHVTTTGVADHEGQPVGFALYQNYPNPFNSETSITYFLKEPGYVMLKVFDVKGREVKTMLDGQKQAGSYTVQFDASGLTSGIYFYQIRTGEYNAVKKMLLLE